MSNSTYFRSLAKHTERLLGENKLLRCDFLSFHSIFRCSPPSPSFRVSVHLPSFFVCPLGVTASVCSFPLSLHPSNPLSSTSSSSSFAPQHSSRSPSNLHLSFPSSSSLCLSHFHILLISFSLTLPLIFFCQFFYFFLLLCPLCHLWPNLVPIPNTLLCLFSQLGCGGRGGGRARGGSGNHAHPLANEPSQGAPAQAASVHSKHDLAQDLKKKNVRF